MKNSDPLYLSAREASAELAISPATLYAYVSRGLIRSEPSPDSRSHRYRAEDIRGLKERRTPSPEPKGFRSFDADLPVMDSAISTITELGPIYRGVNCVELAEKDARWEGQNLAYAISLHGPAGKRRLEQFAEQKDSSMAEAARLWLNPDQLPLVVPVLKKGSLPTRLP